ncbi:MAG: oligopeptide:H+ symporter [Gammaproteobacteria bacterium]|nr:oligopeptide:H+ symporter [Gammaproteobacteria bacterium]
MFLSKITRKSKPFYILFFSEFMARFSLWGVQTLLIFYLTMNLNFTQNHSYLVVGAFTSLTFTSSIIGGYISDKLLGFKKSVLMGLMFILVGNILLLMPGDVLFSGLACISFGAGLLIPNNANLFGCLYTDQVEKSEAYSLYYIATQSGALLGPIVYGFLSLKFGWRPAFSVSIVGLGIWLILFTLARKSFAGLGTNPTNPVKNAIIQKHRAIFAPVLCILIIGAYYLMFQNTGFVKFVFNVIGFIAVVYILYSTRVFEKAARQQVYKILLMIPIVLLFFACAYQITNSLLIFGQNYVHRDIFGYTIPPAFFASAEPIFIVILSPFITKFWDVLDKRGFRLNVLSKIALGIFSTAASFMIFRYSGFIVMHYNIQAPLSVFLLGFLFLGLGELLIMPAIMSEVSSEATPSKIKGTLMGLVFLSLAFSSYIASILATLTIASNGESSIMGFEMVYTELAILLAAVGAFLVIVRVLIKKRKN